MVLRACKASDPAGHYNLIGKTRLFNPYKGPKSLTIYFRIALRFVSYFSRVVAPNKYYFSIVAKENNEI